ncbi:MAG: hypothetical protein KBS86_02915 [Proteobacteria bacterium]|nr:hypothetical protein [Candidatus Enterousia scatequi]
MNKTIVFLPLVALTACNTVAIKPHSLNTNEKIYVDTNGETMRYYLKEELTKRGYNVTVGKKTSVQTTTTNIQGDKDGRVSTVELDGARYVATINEYDVGDYMRILGRFPVCVFNGWKWVDFNVSIADNQTGEEILYWSGMGCKGTVKSDLSQVLDQLTK